MSKQTLIAVAAGLASAVVFALVLTGAPAAVMVAYFAQLPILLIGLSLGLGHGLVAAGSALVAVMIAGGGVATAGLYFVVHALPTVGIVRQSLLCKTGAGQRTIWYPPGQLLAGLTGYAAAMFLLAVMFFSGRDGGLMGVLTPVIEAQLNQLVPTMEAAKRENLISLWRAIFPGTVASSWLVMVVINGVLAQHLLVRSGKNLRPTPTYMDLAVAKWLTVAIAIAAVTWLVGGETFSYVGQTLTIIFGFPFVLQGLAVVHTVFKSFSWHGFALLAFYAIFLFTGWLVLLVAILGFVEPWSKIRDRIRPAQLGKEKE